MLDENTAATALGAGTTVRELEAGAPAADDETASHGQGK